MTGLNLVSLLGLGVFAAVAWAAGGFRRPFPTRSVVGAGGLMVVLAAGVFWLPPTRSLLLAVNDVVLAVLSAGQAGARFLFGPLAVSPGETGPGGEVSVGFVLAAKVLPAVIFFASLMGMLYHLRVMEPIVRGFAKVFHRTMGLSGAEALSGAANIFVGVESAMLRRIG